MMNTTRGLRAIVALALAMALLASGFALGEAREENMTDDRIEAILAGMTLEEKVGQMMVASFRTWKEDSEEAGQEAATVNITELNDAIRACLRECHFGGTVMFGENCLDAEQVLRLVADMQAESLAGGGLPLLVAADQEGGVVSRLSFGTAGVGNMALAATGRPENAAAMAAIHGEELRLVGINTDFAPVVDVNDNPANPVIGVRAFSDVPETVAEYGVAYMEGLHGAGAIATLKHFPGHGNTDTDSHTGFPRIDSTYEELKARELVPFQAGIDAGADMVMTAHIQYPNIDPETWTSSSTGEQVNLPATMSRVILLDILRRDMGFEGVIVSDALEMAAISENFEDVDALRLTINAGANLLILPSVWDAETLQRNRDLVDMAVKLVRDGEIDAARVDDSVRRILALKAKYGLLDAADFTVTDEQVVAAVSGVGSAAHRQAAWDIARQALTLVKNEGGAFPVALGQGDRALILFADSCASRVCAGDLARQLLADRGALPEGAEIEVMVNTADNGEECLAAAERADHVILVSRAYSASCLDPASGDGFSTAVFDRIIEARHGAGQAALVVSCQLPYDAARFPDADAMLLTYGASPMRALPQETGAGSAWAPNLVAALCACFGDGEPGGRLPVDVPALDEGYGFAEEILYPRADADGAGKIVAPVANPVDVADLPDGIYPVAFDPGDVRDDGNGVTMNAVRVFTRDWYDPVDVRALRVGDTIVVEGQPVPVLTLERGEYGIAVNAEQDARAFYLVTEEDANGCFIRGMNDLSTYTEQGTASLTVDPAATFTDAWDIDGEPVTVGVEGIVEAMANTANDSFVPENTTVRVAGGRVVEIRRAWMP